MGTKTLISTEEYLATHYEREPEYVKGELRERSMPDSLHGSVELALGTLLHPLAKQHRLTATSNTRCNIAPGIYRLPDVALLRREPYERVPVSPAIMVAEILSQDDVYLDITDKMAEYAAWGVPHIWLIDPWSKRLQVWTGDTLQTVPRLELPEFNWTCTIDQLIEGIPAEAFKR